MVKTPWSACLGDAHPNTHTAFKPTFRFMQETVFQVQASSSEAIEKMMSLVEIVSVVPHRSRITVEMNFR